MSPCHFRPFPLENSISPLVYFKIWVNESLVLHLTSYDLPLTSYELRLTCRSILWKRSLSSFKKVCNKTLQRHPAGHWGQCKNNTLRTIATHCTPLQHIAHHYNTLHTITTHCTPLQHTAHHYNTLHIVTTYCTLLQHIAHHYNKRHTITTHCTPLQHTAHHYNTLHTITTHCTSLQQRA